MGGVRKSSQEGLTEWLVSDEANLRFHLGQIENPYRSTIAFDKFLNNKGVEFEKSSICEVGCGAGQVLGYFMDHYKGLHGYGIDLNPELVSYGNKIYQSKSFDGELYVDDLYNLSEETKHMEFNGLIMLQVINILPEYEKAIESLQNIKHNWFAGSVLAFEGNIDYVCTLYDYNKDKESDSNSCENVPKTEWGYSKAFYNIWSLPRMSHYFESLGYKRFEYTRFEIDIDLPNVHPEGRGTYTVKLENGSRLQISGGMWMPWYFVYAEK